MIIKPDVVSWTPAKVQDWIVDLFEGDKSWIDLDFIQSNRIDGRRLFLLSADDLTAIGARKVGIQERILEAIDDLRHQLCGQKESLQNKILNLACCSRVLHTHLVHRRLFDKENPKPVDDLNNCSASESCHKREHDKVRLDTLSFVSNVVESVIKVVVIISTSPYKEDAELRSMRSLILALGIELASTAQRDQFVERPNEILEKSSKVLADYCDRIIINTRDPIMIQAL